jgi:hypothetical protein
LKGVISIRFDQNLPQGENWPTDDRIRRQNTEDKFKSEVKSLVCVVSSLFVITMCYSYSETVLQLTVVLPDEYPINWFI